MCVWSIGEKYPKSEKVYFPRELNSRGFSSEIKSFDDNAALACGSSIYPRSLFTEKKIFHIENYKFGMTWLEYALRIRKLGVKIKILTPKYIKFSYRNNINKLKLINNLQKKIGFPLVVKPLNEGSSVNVFICKKNNILKTLTKLNEYGEVLLEKYIPGREIQVAILENKVLGAIELRPTRKFYDYQAKYNPKARTEHIIPVEISKRKYQELTKIALKAHKILNCRGVTRSDFRYYKNSFYLLETNTQPGMTSLSLVPEIAKFNNINFKNLIKKILNDASINK